MRRFITGHPGALLLYTALTCIFLYPLPLHLTTQVIGPFHGDNLEYLWKMTWVKQALFDLHQSPLSVPHIYAPYGYPLATGEITPIHTYLGAPLTALLGAITTYNLFILFSFILSGWFTYLLVHRLTGSTAAALLSGVIFAFCPYRIARAAGHLPLMDTQWIPLFLLALEEFIRTPRARFLVLAGLCYAAAGLSTWYYAMLLALLTPFYFWARLRSTQTTLPWRSLFAGGVGFAAAALALLLPFLLPLLSLNPAGQNRVPLEETVFWAADPLNYLLPSVHHPLWGAWIERTFNLYGTAEIPYEFHLGLSWAAVLLALYGWKRTPKTRRAGWGWWLGLAFLFSLGPVLKFFNRVITIPAPTPWVEAFNQALNWLASHSLAAETFSLAAPDRLLIPLPGLLVRWFVPGLAGMRTWARFDIFVILGVAVLAGYGLAAFLREETARAGGKTPRSATITALVLAGLVLFELYPAPRQLITPAPRPVDQWLAARPQHELIIQMPLLSALSGPQMYYTLYHQHPIASGYGTYLPLLFKERYPELAEFPSDAAMERLINWGKDIDAQSKGVGLVLVDERDLAQDDPFWEALAQQKRLKLVETIDRVRIYEVNP